MPEAELERVLDRHGICDGRLLVAVSGGRDSVVLFEMLRRRAAGRGLELIVAHVNHGLRGEESEADEAHVREMARAAAAEFVSRGVAPEAARRDRNSRSRPSLEEAARDLRRAALQEWAAELGCRWIATAHHAGDQAETVLMRILRGTGPDGLAGMAELSGDGCWLKPMLAVLPADIEKWARGESLDWREDVSNQDRRFARNRLRHDWIPALAETFNPQLLRSLAHLAEAERRDLEWIEALVQEAAEERIEIEPSGIRLVLDGWDEVPDALARRLVRHALVAAGLGREVTRTHLERMLSFLRRGRRAGRDRRLEFPEGIVLRRVDDGFRLALDSERKRVDGHENATVPRRD